MWVRPNGRGLTWFDLASLDEVFKRKFDASYHVIRPMIIGHPKIIEVRLQTVAFEVHILQNVRRNC